jgi:signal transduction histidine kinase
MEYPVVGYRDGKIRWVRGIGTVQRQNNGVDSYFTGVLHEITERKQDEMRKNDFIAMVSHELKTPLTSLKAYLQLLQRQEVNAENSRHQNMLEKSVKQVDYMNSMINGFLNVSRLDSGQLHMDKENFDFNTLFSEIEQELLSTNHTRNFIFKSPGSISILADRDKISQVLHNLIGNAIKYSMVNTSIIVEYFTTDGNSLKVKVQDYGIGISVEDQHRIFERYYRVKDINSRTNQDLESDFIFVKKLSNFIMVLYRLKVFKTKVLSSHLYYQSMDKSLTNKYWGRDYLI